MVSTHSFHINELIQVRAQLWSLPLPILAKPFALPFTLENSEICVAVTNRIWRGFELRSTCDHSTIRWLPVVVLWGINLSNVNFPEKLCSCDVGTEFSIIALHLTSYSIWIPLGLHYPPPPSLAQSTCTWAISRVTLLPTSPHTRAGNEPS